MCERMFSLQFKKLESKLLKLEEMIITETNCPASDQPELKKSLQQFFKHFKAKWLLSNRDKVKFFQNNSSWLDGQCIFKKYAKSKVSPGRPVKDFAESSDRSKRRKTENLRASTSVDELLFSAEMKLRSEGQVAKSKDVKNILQPEVIETAFEHKVVSPQSALSMLTEAKLSKKQYNVVRSYAPHIFPSYKRVQEAKRECYPENIEVTETTATVPLQNLLDHTATRLLAAQADVLQRLSERELTLFSKWGFDGSSGHSQYMQKFQATSSDDKFVFLTCMVPLKLITNDSESKIVWCNLQSSSPRFCRPINIYFKQESVDFVKAIKEGLDLEIAQLVPSVINIDGRELVVKHALLFTMIDGKICNYLTDNKSAMRCLLCNETSKNFNNIDAMLTKPILNESAMSFGLSVLHCWIKFFECCLHIAYKLTTQEWRQSRETKTIIEDRKRFIQREFRKVTGLLVDLPKPGYGNTNVGNSARRFFSNPEQSSRITGVNQELIKRFSIILKTLASGHKINIEIFKSYCEETAYLYTRLYPWYNMPTTVHKVLIHGPSIVSNALMPIGHLSEEAQEARNKDFKKFREFNARKTSRKDTLTDVFNAFLISSDPYISCSRVVRRYKTALPSEVIRMLLPE